MSPPYSPHYLDEYQNKGLREWAIHKRLILKGLDCRAIAVAPGAWADTIALRLYPLFFVSVASKGLSYCASPLFATHTTSSEVLHLKDLPCTKVVHISRVLRGVDGHRRGQELAAIVPRSYCTRGIWARQEELVEIWTFK